MLREGYLGYNEICQRYGLLVSDLFEKQGFHCGEPLEICVNGRWIPTRMEMTPDGTWYLANTPYRGDLNYMKARIKV